MHSHATAMSRKGYAASVLARDDPVSVVLDLMQPAQAGGRLVDKERLTRENETSRLGPPGTPWRFLGGIAVDHQEISERIFFDHAELARIGIPSR